ncbi:hypothetical protein AUP74_01590 [Microbulbifer aggregans]|uniref:DUF3604 domain-containing protein n=1 Tax=Microbulbifer aggregans TaxID=1769779 RepID=A0A1C9W790_9GAMM|nr:DUF3604 domain-containing protein [Microbulbifer aggregans]AOS97025.1 hypothetical protein AUP74_01590 [Microbulbifer aggregans]
MFNRYSVLALSLLLAACGGDGQKTAEQAENPATADNETETAIAPDESKALTDASSTADGDAPGSTADVTATDHNTIADNVYFGNFHVHTSYSFDAVTNGSTTTPADAYRWAKGEAIPAGAIDVKLQIKRPLDFYSVSDHAEYLGVFKKMYDPESPASKLPIAKEITSKDTKVAFDAYARVLDSMQPGNSDPALSNPEITEPIWKEMVETADKFYEPGKFTTFPAFEWTSNPDKLNLHRVVVFQTSKGVPTLPYSALDSDDPRDLWKWMAKTRDGGATLLAIPHNGNASDGLMFPTQIDGEPLTEEYIKTRVANEPLYEVSQIKGTSETFPSLSPNDEFAGFEIWDYTLSSTKVERPKNKKGSYARQAYLDGLSMAAEGRGNPYVFGLIGDSDTHNSASAIEEDNYTGKFGIEASPEHRLDGPIPGDEVNNQRVREFSSGGLAAVWAPENTREAIYAALKRKETYATSGTRLKLRFFGGWNYPQDTLNSSNWVKDAYAAGVPMGGTLQPADKDRKPVFIVQAMKDSAGANLDRIQIIKGWVDQNGEQHQKIFEVALSGKRKPAPDGKVPPVGNTVDAEKATYTNTIGAAQLGAVWTDEEFNPEQHAFYYARVIEIPTPRWSTYDAAKLGREPRDDLPVSLQERGWTSPIWFKPQVQR